MSTKSFLNGGIPYYDEVNFPYGFKLAGDFTIEQAIILENCGHILQGLEKGWLVPSNDDQRHFIGVSNGFLDPILHVEFVWLRYKSCIARKNSVINHCYEVNANR